MMENQINNMAGTTQLGWPEPHSSANGPSAEAYAMAS